MTNPYLDQLQAGAIPTAPPENPYLGMLQDADEQRRRQMAGQLTQAVTVNPEQYTAQRRVAQYLGYPTAVVEAQPNLVDQAKVKQVQQDANGAPVLQRKYTDADFAKLAHDDSLTLADIEKTIGNITSYVMGATPSGGMPGALKRGVWDNSVIGTAGAFRMLTEVGAAASEVLVPGMKAWEDSGKAGGNPLRRLAEGFGTIGAQQQAAKDAASPAPGGNISAGVESGFESAGQNLKYMPLAFMGPPGWAAALTGMVVETGGATYQKDRQEGIPVGTATIHAGADMLAEYVGERYFGEVGFLKRLAAGAPASKLLMWELTREVPGEIGTTLWQNYNDWALTQPGKSAADFLREQPDAVAQTIIATLVGGAVQTGAGRAAVKTTEAFLNRQMEITETLQREEALKQLMKLAGQSKLADRSPEQLQAFVNEASGDAPVRFDAATLMEVFNQDVNALNQALPGVDLQNLQEQAAAGGEVTVLLGELVTGARQAGVEQTILEHARLGDSTLSAAEARDVQGTLQQELGGRVQQIVSEAADQQAAQASHDAVKANILQQLETAGRHRTAVNEGMATWAAAFYTTMGARMGLTAEEFYKRYPLRITGEATPGTQPLMDQGKSGELTVEGYHFSKEDRPTITTAAYGTGLQGSNREMFLNAEDKRLAKRAYFYADKGTGINPESGVGGRAHRAQLTNVYDSNRDPLGLKQGGGGQLGFESRVLDAGFSGYLDRLEGTQSGQVIMLGDQTFRPELLGAQSRIASGQRVPALPQTAPAWQNYATGSDAEMQAMLERMQAKPSWAAYDLRVENGALQYRKKEAVFNQEAKVDTLTSAAQRGERARGTRATFSAEEKAAITASAEKVGVSEREIIETVRGHKLAHPVSQGWAPLTFLRVEIDDKGKLAYAYQSVPYTFSSDKDGRQIAPESAAYKKRVTAVARAMTEEVRRVFRRAAAGDKNAKNILAQAGWYKAMRARLRQEFGGLGDLFADLLGATSPNTPVRDNWTNAVDALRRASRGDFDTLLPQWVAWADKVDALELDLRGWFNERLAEGLSKKAIKALPEYEAFRTALSAARKLDPKLLPQKESGKNYGFNGRNVARAMVDLWRVVKNADPDIGRGGTAPKALNFSGNLIGFRERATIDVWAARMLQRLAGGLRIPSMAETGVSGEMREDGTTTLQFGMGQDIFSEAAGMIRADEELKTDKVLAEINDDDLQAVVWFVEKELWTVNNWTSAAGEGGSFELEASLTGSAEQDRIKELRRVIDSSKSKPAAKAQAREELAALERSVDRFVGGLSIQMSAETQGLDYVPTDADMARLAEAIRLAAYETDDGSTVLASKTLSTEGRYGGVERSLDLEVVAREGYDPNALWAEMLRQAQAAKQDSTFLSRVLRDDEDVDPARHRPGVEIYFREAAAATKLEQVLGDLAKEGVEFLTVIVDGRRMPGAVAGAMPPAVGVRLQYVPEFDQRYGFDDLAGLDDVALAAKMQQKAREMQDIAARVAASVEGVAFAGQFWHETQVAFSHQYQEKLDALAAGVVEGESARTRGQAWTGESVRAGLEGADRQARETASGQPDGGTDTVVAGDEDRPDLLNQTAKVEDTVFAEQKTGLMPEWTWTEGVVEPQSDVLEQQAGKWNVIDDNVPTVEAAQNIIDRRQRGMRRRDGSFSGPGSWEGYEFRVVPSGFHLNGSFQIEARKTGALEQQAPTPRGTFNPATLELVLNPNANLSTFFHETGHFFLEVLADIASQPNAPAQIAADFDTFLKWAGVADAATWNAMTLDEKRPYHERWAESVEEYVMEGRAPSVELQPLMRRFAAWLKSVYGSIQKFLAARGMAPAGGSALNQMAAPEGFQTAVVDAEGKPRAVYHGTHADIAKFKRTKGAHLGFHFGDVEAANTRLEDTADGRVDDAEVKRLARLTDERFAELSAFKESLRRKDGQAPMEEIAAALERGEDFMPILDRYKYRPTEAEQAELARLDAAYRATLLPINKTGTGSNILPVYLALKKPLRMPDVGNWGSAKTVREALPWDSDAKTLAQIQEEIAARGYDGIVYANRVENPVMKTDSYIVFDPKQIVSAISGEVLGQTDGANGPPMQLNDDIRRVMDRLLATDEQIAQANEVAGLVPDEEADALAAERLAKRSVADLKWAVRARDQVIAKLRKQAAAIEKDVRAEVTVEVDQTPEMRAKAALDALQVTPEYAGVLAEHKAQRKTAEAAVREEVKAALLAENPDAKGLVKGQLLAKNKRDIDNKVEAAMIKWDQENPAPKRPVNATDADVATIADSFGFESVDAMLQAIDAFGPRRDAIDGLTEKRMLEEHGDLIDERAISEAANEAVHNEARARSLATELRTQREMLNPRQETGETNTKGSKITVNALVEAAKQFAANVVGRTALRDLTARAWQHTAAERRAAKRWTEATATGKTVEAVQAKQDQMLQHAAAKAAIDAKAEAKKILDFFKRVVKGNDEKVVEKGRDADIVNAARAVLALYGVQTPTTKTAEAYLETLATNDPETYNVIAPMVEGATRNAQPLDALTFDELKALEEEIQAMWFLAKRSRQMEVAGDLMDIEDAADEIYTRLEAIGIPDVIPGETGAVTKAEERARWLQFARALLRRVEQWAEGMDGKYGGPFLRFVFQPVSDAANRYRTDRVEYRKRFQALVDAVAPSFTHQLIQAPELGYVFGRGHNGIGHAELLHALLHTGNESNKRKLLLGRGWAADNGDGTTDTARWDAFIKRMADTGVLTPAHYDFAQGVWDLLEQTKPLAQATHRAVFGRYFAEVTADSFADPWGRAMRGGYVPAQADPAIVADADLRALAERENENMAFAFPATSKGFTKARVEYNRPLKLDLRTIPQHLDKVLLFSHMEPAVRGVAKLLRQKKIAQPMARIDPAAYSGMLLPWLNRSARQQVETPILGDGRTSRVLSALRSRAGAALMFANISNAIQQITGFSSAMVKVKGSHLMQAAAAMISHPKQTRAAVATASTYMANRMENEVAAMNDAMNDILLDPSLYERAQAWATRHSYFLQSALDNATGPIIWTGGYNQALADGMAHEDAVRFADGVIRQTQGDNSAEGVSRIETGPAYARLFTQFIGYFNMLANTNGTALQQVAGEIGLKKGAGKALGIVFFGVLAPIWIAEAIAVAFKGGPDDPDRDGYLDDWLAAVFGMGTIKGLLAQVPFVGMVGQGVMNRFNTNPADDKFSLSPAVSLLESAVNAPFSVYKAIADEGNRQKAVRDTAALISMATGLPAVAVARPLGYLAGVEQGKIQPTGAVDAARGAVTGAASPESKQR